MIEKPQKHTMAKNIIFSKDSRKVRNLRKEKCGNVALTKKGKDTDQPP